MNEKQIKELSLSNLCTIGSHGYAHKDFTSYSLDELVNLEKNVPIGPINNNTGPLIMIFLFFIFCS